MAWEVDMEGTAAGGHDQSDWIVGMARKRAVGLSWDELARQVGVTS